MSQCDHIIVIKNNQITEQGSFNKLMADKSHLAKLIGEHVDTIAPIEELEEELEEEYEKEDELEEINEENDDENQSKKTHDTSRLGARKSIHRMPSISENLTAEQILNRKRFSFTNHVHTTDENLAKLIESNQIRFERNRMSIVSGVASDHDVSIEEDQEEEKKDENSKETKVEEAKPMKLVLEDQSVLYKESPIWSYLKSGSGAIITLIIFVYFFAVHLVRILSG